MWTMSDMWLPERMRALRTDCDTLRRERDEARRAAEEWRGRYARNVGGPMLYRFPWEVR